MEGNDNLIKILLEGLSDSLEQTETELETKKRELVRSFVETLPLIKFKEVIQKANTTAALLLREVSLEDCMDHAFESWLLGMPKEIARRFTKDKEDTLISEVISFLKEEGAKIYGAHYAGICIEVPVGGVVVSVPDYGKCRFKDICKLNT